MNSEWQEYELSETVEMISDKVDVKGVKINEFISTENLLQNLGGIEKSSGLPKNGKVTAFEKGDVLFSNIRTYFRKVWQASFNGACSNDVIVFRGKKIENDFLYYVIADNSFIDYTTKTAKGTKMPRGDKNAINKYLINLPPLPEQKSIAHILGTLDNKIELNRKMNETLEQMAQALFKSWFVDFDPVFDNAIATSSSIPDTLKHKAEQRKEVLASGNYKTLPKEIMELFPSSFEFNDELDKWIPKGWHIGKMEEIVDVKYGKDHKKLEEGSYPCYGSGGVMRYVDSTLCNEESVLIPRKGTLSNIMYVRNPFWSVDTMFFTEFKQPNYVKYLFYFLQKFNFTEMNVGSAVPSMTTKVLNSLNLLQPSEQVLQLFDEKVEHFLSKKEANDKQNETLMKQRNVLLPKLISGQVKVPNVTTEKQLS